MAVFVLAINVEVKYRGLSISKLTEAITFQRIRTAKPMLPRLLLLNESWRMFRPRTELFYRYKFCLRRSIPQLKLNNYENNNNF